MWPLLHAPSPAAAAQPPSIWLQLHDIRTTSARPCLSQTHDSSKTERVWSYRVSGQMLHRDELINLVDLTNMAPWPRESMCLLFSIPHVLCLNHSQVKWSVRESKDWLCWKCTVGQPHSDRSWFFIISLEGGKWLGVASWPQHPVFGFSSSNTCVTCLLHSVLLNKASSLDTYTPPAHTLS